MEIGTSAGLWEVLETISKFQLRQSRFLMYV